MPGIQIFDSTLRDGVQCEGISFSTDDKFAVIEYLDTLGIDFIEAGNPVSNPKDHEFFEKAKKRSLKHAKLVAFSSTHRVGIQPEDDQGLKALIDAGTDYVAVFGKSWDMHVREILGTSLEENLSIIQSSVAYLVSQGKTVFFDAEHFFDGYKANPDYALETLRTAVNAGAHTLVLCDTNGGSFPLEIAEIIGQVKHALPDTPIGIHAHNDTGMADANSVCAVQSGAVHIQGTFGGFGERCGNANLCTIIPDLQLKLGYDCIPPENMQKLTKISRSICEVANIAQYQHTPFVGRCAFSHKGGMHADAVNKNPFSYEHVAPEAVGNKRRVIMSEVAGRASILPAIQKVEPSLGKNSKKTISILEKMKEMEHIGYDFEGAEGSTHLLVLRELGKYTPHFSLAQFNVVINEPSVSLSSIATIKISVDGKYELTAAQGDGPVNALDSALRKALEVFYPKITQMSLLDYKVRVLGTGDGTASKVRVLITSTDGNHSWRTVGVSSDIIDASWKALVDSVEYFLGDIVE